MLSIAEPWNDLTFKERDEVLFRCIRDPVEFSNEPLMCGGSQLRPVQAEIIGKVYETYDDAPLPYGRRKYNVAIIVAGMSSGKTHIASRVIGYEGLNLLVHKHPAQHWGYAKGSWVRIVNLATSKTQSQETVWEEFKDTLFNHSPYFMSHLPEILTFDIRFRKKKVHVKTLGSSGISSAGRNLKCAVIDEQAKFETEEGKRSGKFVFDSLTRSTSRFGFQGLTFSIGSILHDNDPLMTEYKKTLDRVLNPHMIGFKYTTLEMNPHFTQEEYEAHKARDPITCARDFDCVPEHAGIHFYGNRDLIRIEPELPNKLEPFIEFCEKKWELAKRKSQKIRNYHPDDFKDPSFLPDEIAKIDKKIRALKPRLVPEKNIHVLTGDPAIARDAFGLAIAYKRVLPMSQRPKMVVKVDETILQTQVTIDGLWRFRPKAETGVEVDPAFITYACWEAARWFKVRYAAFDTWNFPTTQTTLKRRGVNVVEGGHVVKLADCENFKDRQYYRTIRICNYPFIIDEMKGLIKKSNKVDHPKKGSKDVYDAAVLTTWLLDNPELKDLFEPSGIPMAVVI
jgi:hypothetical protein